MSNFTHLHLHTEYSMLDGAGRIDEIVARAVKFGMKSIAITDHGNMFGMIKFYDSCRRSGVKPIIGCEVYVAPRRMCDKEHPVDKGYHHLVLLAENDIGYKNLIKITTVSYLEGFYYKPRVDKQYLKEHSEGLIAMSACLGGEIPRLIIDDRIEDAKKAAAWYRDTFGPDNFFLEMMDHGMEKQRRVNNALPEISRELGIPLVVSNDVHYVEHDDAMVQEVLMCIEQGETLDNPKHMSFEGTEYYFKSPESMAAIFDDYPDAVARTAEIADRCNVEIEMGRIHLPDFEVPEGKTPDSYLRELTLEGMKIKYPDLTREASERAEFELKVIQDMGFSAYFLIVWDLFRYARSKNIPVGPGRGSVAGSIVAFALDITKIDPLKYGLLFERFLNPERISMPDIDMDFCYERRGELIEYTTDKYGRDRVAKIITFGSEKAKNAIRDTGRVLGIPLPDVDRIAKLVPFFLPDGEPVTIDSAIGHTPELKNLIDSDPNIKRLIDLSRRIQGFVRNISTHAAGIVISKFPLTDVIPICKAVKEEFVQTQYVFEDLEKLGLMKMDFLGLRTLTVIFDAVNHIERRTDLKIDIDKVPLDDQATFRLFSRGEMDGIFQFEGNTIRGLVVRAQPTCFEDLIALNALNRPGPLDAGMDDKFIENRRMAEKDIDMLHPSLRPVLRDTFGIILYQEQVMRIANIIGGFSLAQADILRKAMGKKKIEGMEKLKERFMEGAQANGIDKKLAQHIFELILKFAGYGFNKSHSAAYAFLAYQTAWLKANYPVEFMSALLTSVMGDTTKVTRYIEDCRRMNIEVMLPDINVGHEKFTPVDGKISYGLASIKNVGTNAIQAIVDERDREGTFRSIYDLAKRVDLKAVNSKTIESLIRAGACDSLEGNRAQKMAVLDEAIDNGRKAQKERDSGQKNIMSLFGDVTDEVVTFNPPLPNIPEFDTRMILEDEKELIGLYLTRHPLDPYRKWIRQKATTTTAELPSAAAARRPVTIAGIVVKSREFTTKSGNEQFMIVEIEDFAGKATVSVNARDRGRFYEDLRMDNIVAVTGRPWMRERETNDGEIIADVRVVCSDVETYDSAAKKMDAQRRALERRLHVRISENSPSGAENALIELRNLIAVHRGTNPVVLHIASNSGEKKALLKGNSVRYSIELLRLSRRIFGDENVWVEPET